jgi:hypothetical protein
MSGTINLAFTQQFDLDGVPLGGGLLSFFVAGTTTPQSAFQDVGLTIVHPNPIVLDASGRVPMFYLADGFIKIRLTDKNAVVVIAADQLLVIGPSSGGGGGGGSSSGDVTAALQTGDIKARYDTAVKDGFVRLNGQSIGNVGSSATERQEAVCQPLFVYLWPFPNITLDGFAKGANALADFNAGRRLILPDLRGRTIAGLDDMGATAANRLTAAGLGTSGTQLGNANNPTVLETVALAADNLPSHTHPVSVSTSASGNNTGAEAAHTHTGGTLSSPVGALAVQLGSTSIVVNAGSGVNVYQAASYIDPAVDGAWSGTTDAGSSHLHTVNSLASSGTAATNAAFLATPISKVQPTMVMTWYMKM